VNALRQVTDTEHFTICVVGHLREEKDSLRAAWASRELPDGSTIRIIQAGKAYNDEWRQHAFLEQQNNPRYRWWGEVSQHEVKELMAEARVMVMSSIMEGGANAISEACVAGLPIIASDIAGNRGLLGDDYAGYYPVKDTRALASLMLRAEREPTFLEQLRQHCIARADLFKPEKECAEINKIVDELTRQ
jgi:glycosyltransferase involved in cell wall biosynthesis